jgi:hypothetical protein
VETLTVNYKCLAPSLHLSTLLLRKAAQWASYWLGIPILKLGLCTTWRRVLVHYKQQRLPAEFHKAIGVVRYCLKIRNQYAHWVWWDDKSGGLAFANIEDLAKRKRPVNDLAKLRAYHVDAKLTSEQEAYFVYADEYLAWINYEGRFRAGKLKVQPLAKPTPVRKPKLRL